MQKPQPKLEVERLLSWPALSDRGASASDSELLMAQVPVRIGYVAAHKSAKNS